MEVENNSLKEIREVLEDIRDLLKSINKELREVHETQRTTLDTLPSEEALKVILQEKTEDIIESLSDIEVRIP